MLSIARVDDDMIINNAYKEIIDNLIIVMKKSIKQAYRNGYNNGREDVLKEQREKNKTTTDTNNEVKTINGVLSQDDLNKLLEEASEENEKDEIKTITTPDILVSPPNLDKTARTLSQEEIDELVESLLKNKDERLDKIIEVYNSKKADNE